MITVFRKIPKCAPADISRLRVVKWGDVVRDVDDVKRRVDLQQLSLYSADEIIVMANVGG